MKLFFTFLFTLFFGVSQSQSIDTIQVKQELDSLINLNVRLVSEMELDSAFKVLKKAEVRCLETLGDKNLYYATIINKQGLIYYYWQEYYAIEPLWLETKDIRGRLLGKKHPEYAKSVNNLGFLYRIHGDLELSERYYLEALSIRKEILGTEHKDYGKTLNGLALLYTDKGKYDEAESLYLESIKIRIKQFGANHPEYANSLLNLGNVYLKTARFEEALELYSKTLSIYEKTKGKNCSAYVIGLTNSGDVYANIGELKKAEGCYLEAKEIEAEIYGTKSKYYSGSLYSLGELYIELGQYTQSEKYLLEALEIENAIFGENHKSYADVLNSLGNLYKTLERYEDAEFNFLKTKDIYAIELGKDHSNYAGILNNLGLLYMSMIDYIKAEVHFQESIEIRKRTLGVSHPDYAESLANFGFLYWRKGDHKLAEKCFQGAKDVFENAYGKRSKDYLDLIELMAIYYFEISNIKASKKYYLEADSLRKEFLINATSYLSEKELEAFIETFKIEQNRLLSLAMLESDLSAQLLNNCLFYKGYLLNTVKKKNRLANADSTSKKLALDLKTYRRHLASLYSRPIQERDDIAIEELEIKANNIEKVLVRSTIGFEEASKQVHWQDVQDSLSEGEIAIEFVDFNLHMPFPVDSIQYAAILIRPEDNQPVYIPLFKESSLNELFGTFKNRKSDYVNQLYSIPDRGAVAIEKVGKTLYEIIWEPIEKYLLNTNTIYFASSGALHRINLSGIPLDETNTLGDKYKMVQLNSTRTKVLKKEEELSTYSAIVYGGLDYNNVNYHSFVSEDKIEVQKFDLEKRGVKWNELKWTKTEAEAIYSILVKNDKEVDLMTGINGSEESFKSLGQNSPSPQIIHLATHGFFFTDQKLNTQNNIRNTVFEFNEDPMFRSGILLAGANLTWEEGITNNKTEDGILTAYEISQMDLSNTELVVLSACETGLGDIVGNEGVYGLQRAFKIAGVKYLIMSLWQIPDRQTKDFMTTFYRHYINDGQSISTAFRNTQKEMKDRFYDPYLWAGFVLVE